MADLSNTTLASPAEFQNPSFFAEGSYVRSSRHDQTAAAFRSFYRNGSIDRDSTIGNTSSPSERLTPTSATIKLPSGSRLVPVDNGSTVTVNVYVRKSSVGVDGSDYNGNQPRLILKANFACGITSDVVLDTVSVSNGTWEQLTGTTAAVNADGALEFVVDCDGTAGWINVDDWSVS